MSESCGSLWCVEGRVLAEAIATWRHDEPRPAPCGVNWPRIAHLALRHRVEPLAHRAQRLAGLGAPDWLVQHFADRYRRSALFILPMLSLQRDLMSALAATNVKAAVLKGAPLAVDAFGDVMARTNVDVDVLIHPEDMHAAVRAVESTGLRWAGWGLPDLSSTSVNDGPRSGRLMHATFEGVRGVVELHWRLTPNARLLPIDPRWLHHTRTVEVASTSIQALPLDVELLHLVVHGALHRWGRLKWLADLPALLARHPGLLDTGRTPALASATGVERCLAGGLLMAERTFGPFLSTGSRIWAASVPGTATLLRQSTAALADDLVRPRRIRPRHLPALVLGRLALGSGVRYRLQEMSIMLLEASHQHTATEHHTAALAAAPWRWATRSGDRTSP